MSEHVNSAIRAADELDASMRAFRYVGAIFDAIFCYLRSGTIDHSALMYLCEAGHEIAAQHSKRAIEASWDVRHDRLLESTDSQGGEG
ncbi:hypothetical protein [Burkholderia gladioli]|nr:hypothetical protein [Burkholderia gladioli]MBU9215446.1 hypothetical protein [Burkholderia gladioli]MBU9424466.1 hypothetical protein [Burkholderia gladioli]MDN7724963.1 hypothetical protein [Burkholderia gladioli]MDN8061526.1 hypothetical protein [Burkholderia gladioli]QPQ83681.1 hypothetical protein I6H08_00820 [Burkholderia gladioli]